MEERENERKGPCNQAVDPMRYWSDWYEESRDSQRLEVRG